MIQCPETSSSHSRLGTAEVYSNLDSVCVGAKLAWCELGIKHGYRGSSVVVQMIHSGQSTVGEERLLLTIRLSAL